MNVPEKMEEHDKKIAELESYVNEKKKQKGFKLKIPGKLWNKIKKSNDRAAALFIGPNRNAEWKLAVARDGLWWIETDEKDGKHRPIKDSYTYEEAAVFNLRQGRKMIPIIILFSWRLTPGGGKAEEIKSKWTDQNKLPWQERLIGGKDDEMLADVAGLKKYGQQTIIRGIEQAELDKDQPKKGNFGWLIWVLLGVVGLFLGAKFLGFI